MLTGDALLDAIEELLERHPAGEHRPYLSYIDGALAGLLLASDPVPSADWFPRLGAGRDAWPDNPADGERFADLLQQRQAEIALELLKGGLVFSPVYELNEAEEPIWQLWLMGLLGSVAMRRADWEAALASEDEDIAAAVMGIMSFAATLPDLSGLLQADELPPDLDEMTEIAPGMLPYFVETVYRRRRGLERVVIDDDWLGGDLLPDEPIRETKIGRNDPCPCGSGKKYTKCCLA